MRVLIKKASIDGCSMLNVYAVYILAAARMANFKTHYDNLQVTRKASDAVIRAAYRSLAQKYHPDRYEGLPAEAERVMKILNAAYSVLSDPVLRKEHDECIAEQEAAEVRVNGAELGASEAEQKVASRLLEMDS